MSSNDPRAKPRPWFAAQVGVSQARSRSADAPAVEYPPGGPATFGDSATRFLLTDLEPALQLARQIRREMTAANEPVLPPLARNRRSQAAKLLAIRSDSSAA